MKSCLDCDHILFSDFRYYGGMTGWDSPDIRCHVRSGGCFVDPMSANSWAPDVLLREFGKAENCPEYKARLRADQDSEV